MTTESETQTELPAQHFAVIDTRCSTTKVEMDHGDEQGKHDHTLLIIETKGYEFEGDKQGDQSKLGPVLSMDVTTAIEFRAQLEATLRAEAGKVLLAVLGDMAERKGGDFAEFLAEMAEEAETK